MFKHILFPTDGSASSDLAAQAAMRFAKAIGARVTAIHVLPPVSAGQPDTPTEPASKWLLAIQHAAAEHAVPCEAMAARGDDVCSAILQAAFDKQCDLLAMSARGLGASAQSPPGRLTTRLLTASQLPVLVFR